VGRETVLFFVLNGTGLGIQLACIGFTNYALGLTDKLASNVALLLGICLGTLFSFWSYRKWVWIAPTASPALAPAVFAAEQPPYTPSGAVTSARGTPAQRQEAVDIKSPTA
jgi:hypothetical protein